MTPQLLSVYFRYVRNLSLIERRLTPDLYYPGRRRAADGRR